MSWQDRLVAAIRLTRQVTRLGLKESKELVEAIETLARGLPGASGASIE